MVRDRTVFCEQNPNIFLNFINKGNEVSLNSTIDIAKSCKVCKQQLKIMASPPVDLHVVRGKYYHGKPIRNWVKTVKTPELDKNALSVVSNTA